MASNNDFAGSASTHYEFVEMEPLINLITTEQTDVMEKLQAIKEAKSSISIADMFDMQLRMNKLGQMAEMGSSIISAANTSIKSMTSGIKGQ